MSPSLPSELVDFMRLHKYHPYKLKPSGNGFHRFMVDGDSSGKASGYVKLFPESEVAIFGDFKAGEQIIWHGREIARMSPSELKTHRARSEKALQEAREERERVYVAARERAVQLYRKARPVDPKHPYLLKKNIVGYGEIRQLGNQLLVPVTIQGKLTSLQFIDPDGGKKFLSGGEIKGGLFLVGNPADVICITEGYATACSIHAVTGNAVAVAFNAGNLLLVAHATRNLFPDLAVILCADNDQWTEGNPGLSKATEAALAIRAKLAVPDFSPSDPSNRPSDFNDLYVLMGQNAVKEQLGAAHVLQHPPLGAPPVVESLRSPLSNAIPSSNSPPLSNSESSPGCNPGLRNPIARQSISTKPPAIDIAASWGPRKQEAGTRKETAMRGDRSAPLAPPHMAEAGFPSLIHDVVEVACCSSEAHPVAVAANVVAFFSAFLGRGIHQRIGDAIIHCRPFPLIVGKSGKARKGTAETTVREIFRRAATIVSECIGKDQRLRIHTGGLSTGEGIAWAIRDPREADEKGRGGDPGVMDKRLLAIESEFDNVLSQLRRDNNTLSATIRNLFDGRDIEPLTKTSPTRATRPHVCIIGHITGHELRVKATETDVANGLLNRFMILYVYRPKLVPLPQPTPTEKLDELAQRVADGILSAMGGEPQPNNDREAIFNEAASQLWVEQYPLITRDRDGKSGSLLARSEMYARMLAMIFASMEGRLIIEPADLEAALAWVEYWNASVIYVFNCGDDEGVLDPFVAEVLEIITAQPGITLSGLQARWLNKRTKQVKHALEVLLNLAPPLIEERKEATTGRSARTYYCYEKK